MKKTIYILMTILFMMGCSGKRPLNLGVNNGTLMPCPGSPNCVVSMNGDSKHAIEPISYQGDRIKAVASLKKIIGAMDRTLLVEEEPGYLRYVFKTRIFRFVDDVEFYFPEDTDLIHVRSASRLGYSDLGVNRKRIETIRALFTEDMKKTEVH